MTRRPAPPKRPSTPPTPAPPFLVQAQREKKQHGVNYVTDSRHDTLNNAIAAARLLHRAFNRRVRVQDQAETIWFRLPEPPLPGQRAR